MALDRLPRRAAAAAVAAPRLAAPRQPRPRWERPEEPGKRAPGKDQRPAGLRGRLPPRGEEAPVTQLLLTWVILL